MAALSTVIAGAALGVAAAGTAVQYQQGKEAAKANREAASFQRKQASLQEARQKRDAVRAARLAYGQAQNAAANQGVSSSSSSLGGLASIGSQAADTVSFLDQFGFYSDQAQSALGRANRAESNANAAGSGAGLGFSVFNNADGIAKVFKGS